MLDLRIMLLVEDSRVIGPLEQVGIQSDNVMLNVLALDEVELPDVAKILAYRLNKRGRRQGRRRYWLRQG